VAVLVMMWALGLLGLLLILILSVFRLGLWAIVLILMLAILSANFPLALVMVLLLGSVVAGKVQG
jgi:hypothetical protein